MRTQDELRSWWSRPAWFAANTGIVALVNDGYSGKPSPLVHQLLLLPFTTALFIVLWALLSGGERKGNVDQLLPGSFRWWLCLCCGLELLSILGMFYERRHFARFGYVSAPHVLIALTAALLVAGLYAAQKSTSARLLMIVLLTYASGLVFAIAAFPLNYLRSDMLPVIVWADQRLLAHLNPYGTMHVGARIYDFPYLPGMLVAYLPAVALHLDVRIVTLVCCLCVAGILYLSARADYRTWAVLVIAVFLLCPFLQYRHDLYLAPHWLILAASVVLLRYGRNVWSALLFGLGMAMYQLSWVLFPFFVLHAYRRRGWPEALKALSVGLFGMFLVVAPFLESASKRIARNTVGQWGHMPHALADPINLSYWITFLIRPDQLRWVQLAVMTGMFAYCVISLRCSTLVDTLRWMSWALAIFIMLNVLVDGYFYLTLLLVLMLYTFAASGLWPIAELPQPGTESQKAWD